jgi:OOP family OmpA-OmpF porin
MRKRVLFTAFVGAFALVSRGANAEAGRGFALDRFEPRERGSEWLTLDSLDLRGHRRISAGATTGYAYAPLVVYDSRSGERVTSLIGHQLMLYPGASMVWKQQLRFGVSVPVAILQSGDDVVLGRDSYVAPSSALGDMRVSTDARLYGVHGDAFRAAFGAALFLPTGSRAQYTSDGTVRVLPRATVAGDIGKFAYSARVGLHYRPLSETLAGATLGTELTFGVAAGVRLIQGKLLVGPEVYGSTSVKPAAFFERASTPIEALGGAHYAFGNFRFGGALGTGLARGVGATDIRAFLSFDWIAPIKPAATAVPPATPPVAPPLPHDTDGDGVPDEHDACPELKGASSTDPLTNGCPPDRDGDGVYDAEDACPDAPGPADPSPERSGCPLARIDGPRLILAGEIRFVGETTSIDEDSDPLLLAVASLLRTHPDLKSVRVVSHADASDATRADARAKAIVARLVEYGVAAERLHPEAESAATDNAHSTTIEFRLSAEALPSHSWTRTPAPVHEGRMRHSPFECLS